MHETMAAGPATALLLSDSPLTQRLLANVFAVGVLYSAYVLHRAHRNRVNTGWLSVQKQPELGQECIFGSHTASVYKVYTFHFRVLGAVMQ